MEIHLKKINLIYGKFYFIPSKFSYEKNLRKQRQKYLKKHHVAITIPFSSLKRVII